MKIAIGSRYSAMQTAQAATRRGRRTVAASASTNTAPLAITVWRVRPTITFAGATYHDRAVKRSASAPTAAAQARSGIEPAAAPGRVARCTSAKYATAKHSAVDSIMNVRDQKI